MTGGSGRTMFFNIKRGLIGSLFKGSGYEDLLMPLADAVEEVRRRSEDPEIKRRVAAYLAGDIPEYFKEEPILYMARHVASPNFETLRFLHLVSSVGLPAYIGQDAKDTFVHQNQLKKALGKLPIHMGASMKYGELHERYRFETIVDFNHADGKRFDTIRTQWGESLVEFHNELLRDLSRVPVRIVDDSEWIDRQHRGDLRAHYERFLALFVAHGILFEDYLLEDKEEAVFMKRVLRPAFRRIEKEIGLRPLIVRLTPTSIESEQFWISYPVSALDAVERKRKSMKP